MLTCSSQVFLKSQAGRTITWHEYRSGDTAQLTRDAATSAAIRFEEPVLASR